MECQSVKRTDPADLKHIIWVASYPKSGNTWVRFFINCYMTGVKCDLNGITSMVTRDIDPVAYRSVCPVALPDTSAEIGFGVRFAALLHLIARGQEGDIFLKTHNIFAANNHGCHLCPPVLSKMAVYLIRDPRDVAISFSHHLGISIDNTIEFMCNKNARLDNDDVGFGHFLSSWGNHTTSWVGTAAEHISMCTIRYEGLIKGAEHVFRELVKFLFNTVDEERLQFAIKETVFSNMKRLEEQDGFLEQKGDAPFFRVGKVGQWKDILTDNQVEKIESEIGDEMNRMGYPTVSVSAKVCAAK